MGARDAVESSTKCKPGKTAGSASGPGCTLRPSLVRVGALQVLRRHKAPQRLVHRRRAVDLKGQVLGAVEERSESFSGDRAVRLRTKYASRKGQRGYSRALPAHVPSLLTQATANARHAWPAIPQQRTCMGSQVLLSWPQERHTTWLSTAPWKSTLASVPGHCAGRGEQAAGWQEPMHAGFMHATACCCLM